MQRYANRSVGVKPLNVRHSFNATSSFKFASVSSNGSKFIHQRVWDDPWWLIQLTKTEMFDDQSLISLLKMKLLSSLIAFLSLKKEDRDIDPKLLNSVQHVYSHYAFSPFCEDFTKSKSWNCENILKNEKFNCPMIAQIEPKFDLGYVIFYNPQRNFLGVSFRGSVSLKNLLTDLSMGLSTVKWGAKDKFRPPRTIPSRAKIHAGFYQAYLAIRKSILEKLYESCQEYNTTNLVFTGHSLGGALATITAVDFHDQFGFGDQITIASYGQPRVGDAVWAQYLEGLPFSDRHFRTVAQGDPVPEYPPLYLGFRHAGREILYTDEGQFLHIIASEGPPNPMTNVLSQASRIKKHGIYKNWSGGC